MFAIIRQRLTFLFAMAASAVVLCCGCSDNGIGRAFEELKRAKYGDIIDGAGDGAGSVVNPKDVKEGTFTDSRDEKIYKTVTIGRQTWMAENLNYEATDSSWCYEDSSRYCGIYGRLYNWAAAKSVCDTGWHLPDTSEWRKLVSVAGGPDIAGGKLKSASGWDDYFGQSGNGANDFKFSALPGGQRNILGNFYDTGSKGQWWTATEIDEFQNSAYLRSMYNNLDQVHEFGVAMGHGLSVRCVKN